MTNDTINWSTDRIWPILAHAGSLALSELKHSRITIKDDNTVVTSADIAIEKYFESLFDHPKHGSYLLGEETHEYHDNAYFDEALNGSTWIVDPIDGTASYAAGLPTWGISVARMEKGTIVDGAIFLPRLGEFICTENGAVYHGQVNGEDPESQTPDLHPVNGKSRGSESRGVVSLAQDIVKRGRFEGPNPVHASGSCVWATLHLAIGSLIAYVGTVKLWDIAGGFAILSALGYYMGFPDGRRITTEVNAETYQLDLSLPRRWRLHDHFIAARSEETARAVLSSLHFES